MTSPWIQEQGINWTKIKRSEDVLSYVAKELNVGFLGFLRLKGSLFITHWTQSLI